NIGIINNDNNGKIIEGQYIIVLKKGNINKSAIVAQNYEAISTFMRKEANKIVEKNEIPTSVIKEVYGKSIDGFSAKLDATMVEKLKNDPIVDYIEPDCIIALGKPAGVGKPGGGSTAQETPYGITRVGGTVSGIGKTAWIIDTGIDFDHPDLNVDVARSKTFVEKTKNADDQNGHGTHVAGTIAAIDNDFGVVGVAAGATVVPVRVLDRRGSGTISGVISGVDYVGTMGQSGDVANMSLGGGISQALDDAVLSASAKVKFAIAAGNESDDANNSSPARVNGPNIYTISAMDNNDIFAYFSNFGNPPVDYCAPGVDIKSTWKGGGYNTISGTSMACPHAAGVLLLGSPRADGYVNNDPDNHADAIIHR
ncbi:MAG: S8 family serine peptidase, partial [Bacteroidales bacterium]|nr:S8 family serine peptidase [Bacteroidales bacterium]